MEDYTKLSDEELVSLIQQRDLEESDEIMSYLMNKYKPLVRKKSNGLFLIGAEHEDLIQEGMIGLFKAVRDYRPDKESSFFHFAETCIGRQISSAITTSNRKKHGPLNCSISLSTESGEDGTTLEEAIGGLNIDDPEQRMIEQEFWKEFCKKLNNKLSSMELTVLGYYLDGMTYTEIAKVMDKTPKSIDNALSRIKGKIGDLKAGE